MVIRKKINNH